MTADRFEWVQGGIDKERLNKEESAFVKKMEKDFKNGLAFTDRQGERLEDLYRRKPKKSG